MFTGVKEICLNIKEKHIEKIFKLISKHNGCPELLETLQAVVKVDVYSIATYYCYTNIS